MAEYKGVMIFGEVREGKLAAVTTELLGCGRNLADALGQELYCLLVGNDITSLAGEAIAYGADRVYVVDTPPMKDYDTDLYLSVSEKVARQVMPCIVLFGQTAIGRDLGPCLAFRLGTAISTDCVELAIEPGSKLLLQTKPVYGDNARATFTCESYPQMATVRARVMSSPERDGSREGQIINVEASLDAPSVRTKVIKRVVEESTGIKLEDANVVVCGGRGIGSAEGFKKLEKLAEILKGAVGASRPPCDNGWVSNSLLVGLTGKIIAPDLYIAVALSGSSQHMTGCSGARNIVAINKDPEANIFKEATLGIIGDWEELLPVFTNKIEELMAGRKKDR
ncbi:MAG: electron transfer flavoprotein subunit alpha/FixB family protein [Dehalococcoidales bacterium]|nr:electron transfer flavoprotein subunit alpha/FixB family protein [Dehalococcoidales bacterium]